MEWKNHSWEEATWENWELLKESFLHDNLEDKVVFEGGNIDTILDPVIHEELSDMDEGGVANVENEWPREKRKRNGPAWMRDYYAT